MDDLNLRSLSAESKKERVKGLPNTRNWRKANSSRSLLQFSQLPHSVPLAPRQPLLPQTLIALPHTPFWGVRQSLVVTDSVSLPRYKSISLPSKPTFGIKWCNSVVSNQPCISLGSSFLPPFLPLHWRNWILGLSPQNSLPALWVFDMYLLGQDGLLIVFRYHVLSRYFQQQDAPSKTFLLAFAQTPHCSIN